MKESEGFESSRVLEEIISDFILLIDDTGDSIIDKLNQDHLRRKNNKTPKKSNYEKFMAKSKPKEIKQKGNKVQKDNKIQIPYQQQFDHQLL